MRNMIDFDSKDEYGFDDLCRVVAALRGPGGCPWDAAQTHQSIRRNFLEEAYEACEAMDEDDPDHLCEELGDVLLQVVFHAGIENDLGHFSIQEVCTRVCQKLIFRHPRVFGGAQDSLSWDELKRLERSQTDDAAVLQGVSRALPALWRADKLLDKAQGFGYSPYEDLPHQLSQAARLQEHDQSTVGDLLLLAVALARQTGVDPEYALGDACDRLIRDFQNLKA